MGLTRRHLLGWLMGAVAWLWTWKAARPMCCQVGDQPKFMVYGVDRPFDALHCPGLPAIGSRWRGKMVIVQRAYKKSRYLWTVEIDCA